MRRFHPVFGLLILCLAASAVAQPSNTSILWRTLDGKPPLVVARGGFSGFFPDSSVLAYKWAGQMSLPNSSSWCDVQLTKDGVGICFPRLTLETGSDIKTVFPNKNTSHTVNGKSVNGWFSLDYTLKDLSNITLSQEIRYRPEVFNNNSTFLTVQELFKLRTGQGLWLNIQHDAFFSQNKLSMRNFTVSILRTTIVDYISSPEVNFLRSIIARKPPRTKLVFRFLGENDMEPSTNKTYGTLLRNLTFIKTFSSGILVPKAYIWPRDEGNYLLQSLSLVSDAHTAGLQVFAADFAHDINIAYNFSYDPLSEYLSFIDNDIFSVDGVLSDFPITSSAAIDCFSHIGKNASGQENPLVISSGGSSGDYAPCTNLAYEKAIKDGADIIDCPVQMTKDGIPICLSSIDLATVTNAASSLSNLTTTIPGIMTNGIPTFNVTWSDIQKLNPFLISPYSQILRNPRSLNSGNFMTLSDFLNIAESSSTVSGVLIVIGNAPYLAEKQGIDVIGTVLKTISNSSYKKTPKRVLIQSSDSSVLTKIKENNNSSFELVYRIESPISDADNSSLMYIKRFSNAVVIGKSFVFPVASTTIPYLTGKTVVVQKMHAFGLKVYVRVFRNEFASQALDFFSDPTAEINTYVMAGEIDGLITEFPATSVRYKRNQCLKRPKLPPYMSPIVPGNLKNLIPPSLINETPPNPVLTEAMVTQPPFPAVAVTNSPPGPTPAPPPPRSGQPRMVAGTILASCIAIFSTVLALF